jgi:hypothetical protein
MIDVLRAERPLEPELGTHGYGRLIGNWSFSSIVTNAERDYPATYGFWHFAWVLDGIAIQDVRLYGDERRCHGTSIRFFEPESDLWKGFGVNAAYRDLYMYAARDTENGVVADGRLSDGTGVRSTFEVGADEFTWRRELERAPREWQVVECLVARRA